MTRIEQARQMAHEAHDSIKQVRKYTGEAYWMHTDDVARIVAETLTDGRQAVNLTSNRSAYILTPTEMESAVCAAHLHDVLEDVYPLKPEYSAQLIMARFGDHVMDMVIDLTDVYTKERYPKMNRKERKQRERERIAIVPPISKTIKLADLISNTYSIVEHDADFAHTYLREKAALLPFLKEGDAQLYARCNDQLLTSAARLNIDLSS